MPRFPRSYIKTSYFHIITQGIDKSYIFDKEAEIKYYIKCMYEFKEENQIEIIAYCIMHNHAHILIKTEELKNLCQYMHKLNTKYAIYYNKKYNRVGYVFRNRYKCEGIYSEEHLYNCIKYIYNNPVKAKICNNPGEYKYSSYKNNLQDFEVNEEYVFLDVEEEQFCKEHIESFLEENRIALKELRKNKKILKHLIVMLKNKYDISLREIAKELGMARETVRNIYREK